MLMVPRDHYSKIYSYNHWYRFFALNGAQDDADGLWRDGMQLWLREKLLREYSSS